MNYSDILRVLVGKVMLITLYDFLVFVHILLFVFWLGADMGVAVLGHHFRKRSYSMSERLTILKLLGIIDMFPRSAWALMVPLSLSLLTVGGYWTLTTEVVLLIWLLGFDGYYLSGKFILNLKTLQ